MKSTLKNCLVIVLVLFLGACTEPQSPAPISEIQSQASSDGQHDLASRLVATVGNGSSGAISRMQVNDPWKVDRLIAPAGPESILRQFGSQIFLVNRSQSRIDLLDRNTLLPVRSYSTGHGSRPMDILVIGHSKAIVTDFNGDHLLILDLETGALTEGVSLEIYADSDGLPDMVNMERVGSKIYVQLQRYDRNTNIDHGSILAVINLLSISGNSQDEVAMQLLPGIDIAGKRPAFKMQYVKEKNLLYVGSPGERLDFGGRNTGIEEINLITEESQGFFITEGGLGGDMGPFAIIGDRGFSVFHTSIVLSTHLAHFRRGQTLGELRSTTEGWNDALVYDEATHQIFYGEPSGFVGFSEEFERDGEIFIYDSRTALLLSNGGVAIGAPPTDFLISR